MKQSPVAFPYKIVKGCHFLFDAQDEVRCGRIASAYIDKSGYTIINIYSLDGEMVWLNLRQGGGIIEGNDYVFRFPNDERFCILSVFTPS